jgi:hypothetical protein
MTRTPTVSEQIRGIIDESQLTRYALAQAAGIDHATMSRFMSEAGGLSLAAIDRIGRVLGMRVVVANGVSRMSKGSTTPGHINQRGQRVIRRVGPSPNHRNQYTYELQCTHCDSRYGANGCDIDGANRGVGRRCPECQNGTSGDPI